MNNLYVYLPCYNEAGNIEGLAEEWLSERETLMREGYQLHITCVDDKSTDDTLDILERLTHAHQEVKVIPHRVNQNLGGVLDTSVTDFLKIAGEDDLFCFMDADNTHKPTFVHTMLENLREVPSRSACVIASRYQPGSRVKGLAKSREWFSDMARLYYTVVLHVPHVRDYTCGYRLYTQPALAHAREQYGDKLIENRSFACMMELLYKLHCSGCQFAEVPFCLYYGDKEGKSKMNLGKTIHDSLITTLKLRFSGRKRNDPNPTK